MAKVEYFDRIAFYRRQVADLLDEIDDEQWNTPSLCGEWNVREVAAHLTSGWNIGLPKFFVGMVKAKFDFNRANAAFAKQLAAQPPGKIVADLRANAEHRFTPPGSGSDAPLGDIVVHGFDMFIPLGIDYEVEPDDAMPVLELASQPRAAKFLGMDLAQRFALRATDVDWEHTNEGKPLIEGPAIPLLLAAMGRSAMNDQLTGAVDQI